MRQIEPRNHFRYSALLLTVNRGRNRKIEDKMKGDYKGIAEMGGRGRGRGRRGRELGGRERERESITVFFLSLGRRAKIPLHLIPPSHCFHPVSPFKPVYTIYSSLSSFVYCRIIFWPTGKLHPMEIALCALNDSTSPPALIPILNSHCSRRTYIQYLGRNAVHGSGLDARFGVVSQVA